jgi:hypothetical protein
MAQAPIGVTINPYADVQRRAARRDAIAQAMMQQALSPSEGQQTALSPFVKAFQAFMANRVQNQADKRHEEYQQGVQNAQANDVANYDAYMRATGGKGSMLDPEAMQTFQGSTSPVIQQLLAAELEARKAKMIAGVEAKDTINLRNPDGSVKTATQMKDGTIVPIEGGAVEAMPLKTEGGVGVDPLTFQPVKQAPQTPTDPVIRAEPKPGEVVGEMVQNPLALDAKVKTAAAGAARQQTFVNTGEKSYATQFAGELAKSDIATIDAARDAPGIYRTSSRIIDLLQKAPITGPLATQRVWLERAFAEAGLVDGKRVANTEQLVSEMVNGMLARIKSSGMGTGNGFTEKDAQRLQEAALGRIDMSAAGIRGLAESSQRAARALQIRARPVVERVRKNPATAAFADGLDQEINTPLGDGRPPLSSFQR